MSGPRDGAIHWDTLGDFRCRSERRLVACESASVSGSRRSGGRCRQKGSPVRKRSQLRAGCSLSVGEGIDSAPSPLDQRRNEDELAFCLTPNKHLALSVRVAVHLPSPPSACSANRPRFTATRGRQRRDDMSVRVPRPWCAGVHPCSPITLWSTCISHLL